MFRKSRWITPLVVVLGGTAFVGAASSQTGLNTSSVSLQLRRGNDVQMSFSVNIPHVESVDVAIAKLRPEIDRLADELKHAPIEKQP